MSSHIPLVLFWSLGSFKHLSDVLSLITTADQMFCLSSGRGTYGSRPGLGRVKPKKKAKKTFEDEYWENYEPPKYMRNKYFWVATSVLTVCAAWYSTVVNGGIK